MSTLNKSLSQINAENFLLRLKALQSQKEREKIKRYFKEVADGDNGDDVFIGVGMGQVFTLAKEFVQMPLPEIEILLENSFHEARVGAVSIMDFQARNKKTSEVRRKELFTLYINRHDRINNWDLVDRSAPYVVGGYLFDKSRDVLYRLAVSDNMWERRTAIVSTYYFIRQNEVEDTFKIAEILVNDKQDLIHKATGGWLREAGTKDRGRLLEFLDKYASNMPRTTLSYAIEHLDKTQKNYYLGLKKLELSKEKSI